MAKQVTFATVIATFQEARVFNFIPTFDNYVASVNFYAQNDALTNINEIGELDVINGEEELVDNERENIASVIHTEEVIWQQTLINSTSENLAVELQLLGQFSATYLIEATLTK